MRGVRTFLWILASLALLPIAEAGSSKVQLAFDHEHINLPDEGRALVPLYGKFRLDGRTCATDVMVTADLTVGEFPPGVGASVSPGGWRWRVPRFGPAQTLFAESNLSLVWDIKKGAPEPERIEHVYTVQASAVRIEGGPCAMGSGDAEVGSSVKLSASWKPPHIATGDVLPRPDSSPGRTGLQLDASDAAALLPVALGISAAAVALALWVVARRP